MKFFSRHNPIPAMHDFMYVIRTPLPHKLGILGVCAAVTYLMIYALVSAFTPKPHHHAPVIYYVKSLDPSRSLAQIVAQQKIDAPIEAAARAKKISDDKAAEAKRRAQFHRAREILKSYGLD